MIKKDIRVLINDKRIWVIVTAVIILVIAGVLKPDEKSDKVVVKLGVVDNEKSDYTRLLLNFFEDNGIFTSYVSVIEDNEEKVSIMFEQGLIDMYLIIPPGFTEELIKMNNLPVRAVINTSDKTRSVMLKNLLDAYSNYITAVEVNCQTLYEIMVEENMPNELINDVNVSISYDLIFTALGKDDFFKRIETERFKGIPIYDYYIYSMIVLVILYSGMLAGINLLYEKRNGIFNRLRSVGVKTYSIVLKKLVFFTAVYSITAVVALGIAGIIYDNSVNIQMILLLVAGIFISCLFFLCVSMIFKSIQSYMISGNMLILLSTIIGGGIIPIMYLPEAIVKVAGVTPNYWFIKFMLKLT